MCNPQNRCCILGLPLTGVALVALGIALPFIVYRIQDDALKKQRVLPKGQGHYSDEAYNDFLNDWVYREYYLYNFTNVKDAIINGSKLRVREEGPIYFQRYSHKFDITYPNRGGKELVQYLSWAEFIYRSDVQQKYTMNETFVQVNGWYVQVVGATLVGTETNLIAQGASVGMGVVNTTYTRRDGSLANAFKFLGVRAYLLDFPNMLNRRCTTCMRYVTCSSGSCSATSELLAQWTSLSIAANGAGSIKANASATYSAGFELLPVFQTTPMISSTVAQNLWATANPLSFVSTTGIQTWFAVCRFCSIGTESTCSTLISATSTALAARTQIITVALGGTDSVRPLCLWAGGIGGGFLGASQLAELDFEKVVTNYTATQIGDTSLTDWKQLGLRQFGNSDILSTLGGSNFNDAALFGGNEFPTDFAHYTASSAVTSKVPGGTGETLTTTEAAVFLSTFGTLNYVGLFINVVRGVFAAFGLVGPAYDTSSLASSVYAAMAPQVRALLVTSLTEAGFTTLFVPAGLNNDCTNFLEFYYYLYQNLGEDQFMNDVIRGSLAEIKEDGTGSVAATKGPRASGLFISVSMKDMLNGYQDSLGTALRLPGWGGYIDDITFCYQCTNVTDQIRRERESHMTDRYTAQIRGVEDFREAGNLYQWEGVERFKTWADLYKSRCSGALNAQCAGAGLGNSPVWNLTEVITGFSEGARIEPFGDDLHNGAINEAKFWFNDARRIVPLTFVTSKEVKGIKANQYLVDDQFFGIPIGEENEYWGGRYFNLGDPQGILDISSTRLGVPIVMSTPWFSSNLDGSVINTIVPLNFGPNRMLARSELMVEPWSGFTVSGRKKLMVSWEIRKTMFDTVYYEKLFTHNDTIYLPGYWGNDFKEIEDDDANAFIQNVYVPRQAGVALAVILSLAGASMFVAGIYIGNKYGYHRADSTDKEGFVSEDNKKSVEMNETNVMGKSTMGASSIKEKDTQV